MIETSSHAAAGDHVSLPRFFKRVADAIGPLAELDLNEIGAVVKAVRIGVVVHADAADSNALRQQAELACNLLARLYPRLSLAGPPQLTTSLQDRVRSINPRADVKITDEHGSDTDVVLVLQPETSPPEAIEDPAIIRVSTAGWNVAVDRSPTGEQEPFVLAALAGACLGVAEVFRYVFRAHLREGGRTQAAPSETNLITWRDYEAGLPDLPTGTDLTGTSLVGAGAVGQAFLLALRAKAPVGTLAVVDHQHVSLSNLQRYVLTDDDSVDRAKTAIAADYFAGTALTVQGIDARWGTDPRSGPQMPTVVVALDSAVDRLGVAAGLHGRVYNAWTQPEDLGWSRHETFGNEPCLACLYWPDRPRPSEYELIAQALGQHPLRMLLYLTHRTPIGQPLPMPPNGVVQLPQAPGLEPPPDLQRWFHIPLAADLVTAGKLSPDELESWASRPLAEVYRDGVCAGGLITVGPPEDAHEALVPLAHQSALAGVMLAIQLLVASYPPLRERRPPFVEGRVNLLRPLPQTLERPRQRTPGCVCGDADFQAVWQRRWAQFPLP
ncbi:ThiF family adenylyltransferase [Micromonospora sp. NPDC048930]|uniref:ThiF family adenylyltransferase n=1 Tax=Micromonospora sp. NPDC048930 TaxID=3364261 RepID=UPI003713B277